MNRTGAVLVGLVAAAMGFASRSLLSAPQPDGVVDVGMGFFALFLTVPFLLTVIGGAVAAFRGIWLSTQRAELSSRLAMGATRRSLLASEALMGLRDGAIAGAVGLALGAGIRQGITGLEGSHINLGALADWCAIMLLSLACGTVGYWLAATWLTRGSIREVSAGVTQVAPSGGKQQVRRKRRWAMWTAVGLAVASVICTAVVDGEDLSGFGAVALGLVVALGVYLALPALLLYCGAVAGAHVIAWAATLLRRGTHGASARAIASDGLLRHTTMRAGALLAVAAIMAVSTVFATMMNTSEARSALNSAAYPHGTVSTVPLAHINDDPPGDPGWQEPLPADLVDALEADERLVVVPAGVLVTDSRTFASEWMGDGSMVTTFDVLIAPGRDDLRLAAPDAVAALYFAPGVEWGGDGRLGAIQESPPGSHPFVEVNGTQAEVTFPGQTTPFAGVDRGWAEEQFGPAPTAAVLLYPADEGVSVAEAMRDLDTAALFTTGRNTMPVSTEGVEPAQLASITAPFLAIAVCVVVALAWATQRTRAKDHATLIALGAQASALRGAASLEAGITTAAAAIGGLGAGAVMAVILDLLFTSPTGLTLTPLFLWNAGFTLTQVPWLTMAAISLGAVALAMLGALLIRTRMDRLSPSQQLVEAQKVGVA